MRYRSPMKRWLALVGWIALSFAAAFVGSRFAPGPWYDALQKPSWNPPAWVFGPVWTVLYAAMGVAAWRVWRTPDPRRRLALGVFVVQLALNAAWSWIFFGLHRMGLAFAEILVLWLLIAATTALFWRIDRLAGALFLPYWAWVSFAAVLNATLWQLNR